jgi:hypothetical protein
VAEGVALLLAALGGEVGGAHGAAVLVNGARGVGDARALLLAALGGEVGGAHGAAVLVNVVQEASVTLALYCLLP